MNASRAPLLLVMAGGTGGHIMPGLAIAQAMQAKGWRIRWLGTDGGMEEKLVPEAGYELIRTRFEGWVGKGWLGRLRMPFKLLAAIRTIDRELVADRPQAAIGLGGFPTVPGGLWAWWRRCPLLIHQSDVVAGVANRLLARLAQRVLVGFEACLREFSGKRCVTGNPIRAGFAQAASPEARWAGRSGPLRLLVLGGSRGAQWLNETVPQALAQLPPDSRPEVVHQCGRGALAATQQAYQEAGVRADIREFIDDTLEAMLVADCFLGRSGASTVSELAAVGLGAIFVPYPHHADQQQLHNARVLKAVGAARICEQQTTSAVQLAAELAQLDRARCLAMAQAARTLAQPDATERICAEIMLVAGLNPAVQAVEAAR